jgi:hypothetical protein
VTPGVGPGAAVVVAGHVVVVVVELVVVLLELVAGGTVVGGSVVGGNSWVTGGSTGGGGGSVPGSGWKVFGKVIRVAPSGTMVTPEDGCPPDAWVAREPPDGEGAPVTCEPVAPVDGMAPPAPSPAALEPVGAVEASSPEAPLPAWGFPWPDDVRPSADARPNTKVSTAAQPRTPYPAW